MRATILPAMASAIIVLSVPLRAQDASSTAAEFEKNAKKLREAALLKLDPQVAIPRVPREGEISPRYPWKTGIVSTVFWIGSAKKGKNGNQASAWDPKWEANYGGFDNPNPEKRHDFIPAAFTPRLNPFYIALPYNDVGKGETKPEARVVIPWFKEAFVQEGQSVCRDRWVAIRNGAYKVCYAQWSDSGPFSSDQWQYVFGNEKPKPNANGGAGLNVSPAVREYLDLDSSDVVDWKFVEIKDVPNGPWALFGENNQLVQDSRRARERANDAAPPTPATPSPAGGTKPAK